VQLRQIAMKILIEISA